LAIPQSFEFGPALFLRIFSFSFAARRGVPLLGDPPTFFRNFSTRTPLPPVFRGKACVALQNYGWTPPGALVPTPLHPPQFLWGTLLGPRQCHFSPFMLPFCFLFEFSVWPVYSCRPFLAALPPPGDPGNFNPPAPCLDSCTVSCADSRQANLLYLRLQLRGLRGRTGFFPPKTPFSGSPHHAATLGLSKRTPVWGPSHPTVFAWGLCPLFSPPLPWGNNLIPACENPFFGPRGVPGILSFDWFFRNLSVIRHQLFPISLIDPFSRFSPCLKPEFDFFPLRCIAFSGVVPLTVPFAFYHDKDSPRWRFQVFPSAASTLPLPLPSQPATFFVVTNSVGV